MSVECAQIFLLVTIPYITCLHSIYIALGIMHELSGEALKYTGRYAQVLCE